jgi:hypothetical protein
MTAAVSVARAGLKPAFAGDVVVAPVCCANGSSAALRTGWVVNSAGAPTRGTVTGMAAAGDVATGSGEAPGTVVSENACMVSEAFPVDATSESSCWVSWRCATLDTFAPGADCHIFLSASPESACGRRADVARESPDSGLTRSGWGILGRIWAGSREFDDCATAVCEPCTLASTRVPKASSDDRSARGELGCELWKDTLAAASVGTLSTGNLLRIETLGKQQGPGHRPGEKMIMIANEL